MSKKQKQAQALSIMAEKIWGSNPPKPKFIKILGGRLPALVLNKQDMAAYHASDRPKKFFEHLAVATPLDIREVF